MSRTILAIIFGSSFQTSKQIQYIIKTMVNTSKSLSNEFGLCCDLLRAWHYFTKPISGSPHCRRDNHTIVPKCCRNYFVFCDIIKHISWKKKLVSTCHTNKSCDPISISFNIFLYPKNWSLHDKIVRTSYRARLFKLEQMSVVNSFEFANTVLSNLNYFSGTGVWLCIKIRWLQIL